MPTRQEIRVAASKLHELEAAEACVKVIRGGPFFIGWTTGEIGMSFKESFKPSLHLQAWIVQMIEQEIVRLRKELETTDAGSE